MTVCARAAGCDFKLVKGLDYLIFEHVCWAALTGAVRLNIFKHFFFLLKTVTGLFVSSVIQLLIFLISA
jgi:hypothetical protein